eukprot:tig00021537_g22318.t1
MSDGKKLSSNTLQLKFMQKKRDSGGTVKASEPASSKAAASSQETQWPGRKPGTVSLEREHEPFAKPKEAIGRRSFGKFNPQFEMKPKVVEAPAQPTVGDEGQDVSVEEMAQRIGKKARKAEKVEAEKEKGFLKPKDV